MRWVHGLTCVGMVAAAVFAASPCRAQARPSTSAPTVTVLRCGHLIDTLSGRVFGPTVVTITGDGITAVVEGAPPKVVLLWICRDRHPCLD